MKKKRLQTPFNDEEWRFLKSEASVLGISMADVVRLYFNLGRGKRKEISVPNVAQNNLHTEKK